MQLMSASLQASGGSSAYESDGALSVNPKPLGWVYDVMPDGQRFLVNSLGDEGRRPLVLVTDWASGLTAPPR